MMLGNNSFGQIDESKWRLGAVVGPQVSLKNQWIQLSKYTGYYVKPGSLNLSAGLQIQRNIGQRFTLISGVNYLSKGITGTYYCHVCDLAGPIEPERIEQRFVEIPLALRYNMTVGKLSFHTQLGMAAGLSTRNPERFFITEGIITHEVKDSGRFSEYNLDGNIGIGFSYQITDLLQLEATGFYEHSLLNKSFYRQNSTGVEIGVSFQIK